VQPRRVAGGGRGGVGSYADGGERRHPVLQQPHTLTRPAPLAGTFESLSLLEQQCCRVSSLPTTMGATATSFTSCVRVRSFQARRRGAAGARAGQHGRRAMVPEAAQGWGFGGTSSSGRGDADGAYAAREDASRGWYDRRNSGGDAAAARSKPLRPLSRQGATLLACLNVSPDLFDEAVEKQVLLHARRMPRIKQRAIHGC
jgi:hypothetical protein